MLDVVDNLPTFLKIPPIYMVRFKNEMPFVVYALSISSSPKNFIFVESWKILEYHYFIGVIFIVRVGDHDYFFLNVRGRDRDWGYIFLNVWILINFGIFYIRILNLKRLLIIFWDLIIAFLFAYIYIIFNSNNARTQRNKTVI